MKAIRHKLLLLIFIIQGCAVFPQQEIMASKIKYEISPQKIYFTLREDSCRYIVPDLVICMISGGVKSFNERSGPGIMEFVYDNSGEIGFMIFYDKKDNNIYVQGVTFEEGEVIFKGRPYHYELKYNYYNIGKATIENKLFKPSFPVGTRFSFRKHKRRVLDFLDYTPHKLIIHVPGLLKPAFISYIINLDGKTIEVIP